MILFFTQVMNVYSGSEKSITIHKNQTAIFLLTSQKLIAHNEFVTAILIADITCIFISDIQKRTDKTVNLN